MFTSTNILLSNLPSSILGKTLSSSVKLTTFTNFSNIVKSISFDVSPQINSFLFLLIATESIPHNFTPLKIKGITEVFSLFPLALPQAATIKTMVD